MWRTAVVLALLAGLVAIGPAATTATPATTTPATGVVPPSIVDRYLTRRPPLGPVTVVDVSGESSDRRLLAATLQGVVNRTAARIYLVGARAPEEDQRWLDAYEAEGLITIADTVDLDTAVHRFKDEVAGYVLADAAEPWTINTATSAAGATGSVVATPATVGTLQAEGLVEVDDHRGRWPDAATAYEASAALYRSQLAYQGVAIQQPDRHMPRDLFVQQGVLTVYTRPSQPDFDRVYDLLETYPSEHPVYGYVSDTGDEEVVAVARLASTGRFLVPTDTTDNLSFHIAVGAAARSVPPTRTDEVAACDPATVNVVVAFSDGDNMAVPESRFPTDDNWGSPRRGELPVGWGISPAAAVLMPAIWDHYTGGTTPADEVVDMMGLGYTYGSVMPDQGPYLRDGMRARAALGVRATWSLDALLSKPDAAGWAAVARAADATGDAPDGFLLNYGRWPGPPWFHSTAGFPVIASQQTSYDNTAADIAAQVQALVGQAPADRPLVTFIAATVWQTSYQALADALLPLEQQGVRFLTPSEAFACLPAPAPPTSTTTSSPASTAPPTTAPPAAPAAEPVANQAAYVG